MIFRKIKTLSIVLVFCLYICSCGNNIITNTDIVGTWTMKMDNGNTHTYILEENGNISVLTSLGDSYGSYVINGNTIDYVMTMPNGEVKSKSITFELLGDELLLTTGPQNTYTYYRQ